MSKAAKEVRVFVPVLHVTRGGQKIRKAEVKGDYLVVGQDAWKATEAHLMPGKIRAVCVQGQSEARPMVGGGSPITSHDADNMLNDNTIEQAYRIAQANDRKETPNTLLTILVIATMVVSIGAAVITQGKIEDVRVEIVRLERDAAGTDPNDGVTVTHASPGSQSGGLGQKTGQGA